MWTMKGDSRGERNRKKARKRREAKKERREQLWTQGQSNVAAAGGKLTFNANMNAYQAITGRTYLSLHTSMPPKEVEAINAEMERYTRKQPEPPPELKRAMSNRQAKAGWKEESE